MAESPRVSWFVARWDKLAVALIVIAALVIAHAGWRYHIIERDLIPQAISARALVEQGLIPDRGTLTSFASFTPPGTTWLLASGMLFTHDLAIIQMPGAALLFVLTCVGLYLLTHRLFDARIAVLAVALFAFSDAGMFYAASLWQRAHPAFYVWMCYFAILWAKKRDGRFLAAALFVYAMGLYVFLELAPALLVIPVAWAYRRPPIRLLPLVIAGSAALLIWLPYLRFESTRGFIDLRSQIQRVNILPTDVRASFCDPLHTFITVPSGPRPGDVMTVILLGILLLAVIQRRRVSTWLLLLPLALLCYTAGFERPERYWWLWALESVVIAGALYRRPKRVQWLVGVAAIVLVCVIPIGSGLTVKYQLELASRGGYSGVPGGVLAEVERLDQKLRSEGVTSTSIAYDMPTDLYPAEYHAVDPRYKVGMEYDLLLGWQYDVTNTATCAEGTALGAEYTITD